MRAFTTAWYLSLSAYWFATSFKWFLVLLALLPARVAAVVPEGEKNAKLGLLLAVGAVMALVGPPVMGYLSDRFPTRWGRRLPYLVVGSLVTALALVLMAHAPSYAALFLAFLLLQVGDDLATGPYSALIPDLVPRDRRGAASGWMGALQLVAQVAAGGVGVLAPNPVGLFYLIALVNLLAAAWTAAVIREPVGVPPRREAFVASLLAPWRSPNFRWVWATRFLVMFGQYAVQTYLQFYLADVVRTFAAFGRTLAREAFQAVALLGLLISLGGALSAVPAGRVSDRLGRKAVIYASGGVLALTFAPLLLYPRFDVLIGLSVVFGLAFGAYLAVDWALAADVLPNPKAHATDMGIWQTSIVLPQVLAGSLGGVVDRMNQAEAGSGYAAVFVLAALAFFAGTVLVRQVRGVR
ncbi:MFS transporter [Marinithermus hydrothermalis]|uniref:Major facilitator superfamily MFS_1 n=1 Tax=Marinithermus hydrothermalis (strain DSM 14884 / JCM 11576 / T1) TaxID=869210 RepID=F2NNN5_MARHT|nr:MFS transporter [Marinithermus hydrothermalis]AEB11050.1 major facilitator superfamily MFS_1 [Marinithermus hydrothermalis DSM 14884]